MGNSFWFKICPFCDQGRLFVFKNLDSNRLYFHREDCERVYNDPQNIDKQSSFLTLLEDFNSVIATKEDINKFGWNTLDLKLFNQ
jgi:hypothetical protein